MRRAQPGRATPADAILAAAFSLAAAIPALAGGDAADAIPSPALLLLGASLPALVSLALLARRSLLAGAPLPETAGCPDSRRAAGRDLLHGALCGALAAFALLPLSACIFALLARFGIEPVAQKAARTLLAADTPAGFAACAVAVVLVAPLGEELLYRAILLRGLRARLPAAAAVPLAAAFFAAMHLDAAHAPGLFFAGLLFCLLYDRGSLALSFGAHAAFNAVNGVFLLASP